MRATYRCMKVPARNDFRPEVGFAVDKNIVSLFRSSATVSPHTPDQHIVRSGVFFKKQYITLLNSYVYFVTF